MKTHKKIILFSFILILIIGGVGSLRSVAFLNLTSRLLTSDEICPQCQTYFTDGVEIHEKAYRKEGIKPQKDFKGLDSLRKKNVLKKIHSNHRYTISNLQHSVPLLMPKAVSFLNKLSDRYQKKCRKMGMSYIPFKITSLTRSIESVQSLACINSNAIENSAHLKGKTFDICYTSFGKNLNQKIVFIETLKELREEKKCFAKYEFNQKCLHVTVR